VWSRFGHAVALQWLRDVVICKPQSVVFLPPCLCSVHPRLVVLNMLLHSTQKKKVYLNNNNDIAALCGINSICTSITVKKELHDKLIS